MKSIKLINKLLWAFNALATVAIGVLAFQFFIDPEGAADMTRSLRNWKLKPVNLADGAGPRTVGAFAAIWDMPLPLRYVPPATSGPPPESGRPAPPAISKIVQLNGVFGSDNPALARAILMELATKKTHLLAVGELIPGASGARVKKILADAVVVDVGGGVEEKLSIKKAEGAGGAPGRAGGPAHGPLAGGPPPPGPTLPVASSPAAASSAAEGSSPAGAGAERISKTFQTRQDPNRPYYWFVDRREPEYLLRSMNELRGEIALRPVMTTQGTMQGVQVENIHPNSILRDRGILAGDIIRKVNGIAITSQDQGNDLMNHPQIRNASRYDVEIERQGQIITMTYEMNR